MSYKITVLKSEVTKNPKGYSIAEIAYKTDDGKAKGMKVLDYAQKDVFAVVKDAKPGDVLDADFEKNTKGFWAFKTVSNTGFKETVVVPATPNSTAPSMTRGDWETSEERAAKQVMIVRQSSISNAIASLELNKQTKATTMDIIEIAQEFEDYVLGTTQSTGEID